MMKKSILALALVLLSGVASANQCPMMMGEIDRVFAANTTLTDAQKKEVMVLRADGEALHKAGKHAESMEALARAKALLGMK